MPEYATELFQLVNNADYAFYKLCVNGECPIDKFLSEVERNSRSKKSMVSIIALMDSFGPRCMLPKTKFRQIESVGRRDVFEFKKDDLRVYVVKQKPKVFVVIGGFKKNQDPDIRRLKTMLKDFPEDYQPKSITEQ